MKYNEDSNSNHETRPEDEERLLESYKNAHKKFTQYFSLLMGFSLIFLFIILFPYISILETGYTNQKNLTATNSNISATKNIINYTQASDKGVKDFMISLNKYNSILEDTFLNLNSVVVVQEMSTFKDVLNEFTSNPQSNKSLLDMYEDLTRDYEQYRLNRYSNITFDMPENFNDCNNINTSLKDICNIKNKILTELNQSNIYVEKYHHLEPSDYRFPDCDTTFRTINESWMKCNLNMKIQEEILRMNTTLADNITLPLEKSKDAFIPIEDIQNISASIKNLMDQSSKLKNDTVLGLTYSAQTQFQNISNKYIDQPIRNLENYTQTFKSQLQAKLQQLNETQKELLLKINKTLDKEEKIADRLTEIQFPFGKLPITLNESIVVFPIALGIGFIICSIYLVDSIRLRKQLHNLYIVKYSESNKERLNKRTLLLTPLWIDPLNSKTTIILKFVILVIPLLIFALSLYAIMSYILFSQNHELYDTPFFYESTYITYITYIFVGLYLLCIGLFAVGIFNILREMRTYRLRD